MIVVDPYGQQRRRQRQQQPDYTGVLDMLVMNASFWQQHLITIKQQS